MSYKAKADKCYIFVQRGDEEMAPNKDKFLGLKNGMLGYLDPQDWSTEVVFSDYFMGETCILEVDRSWRKDLPAMISPYGNVELAPTTFRRTTDYFDSKQLAPYVEGQCPDFLTKFYTHKGKLPVLKTPMLPKSLAKSSKDNPWKLSIADVGQITAGAYTIGAGAHDYPTFGGVGGGWAALGNLTGNLTFTLSSSITETATALGIIELATHTLTNTSDSPHYGDPTVGWLMTWNHALTAFNNNIDDAIGGGSVVFEHFHSLRTVNCGAGVYAYRTAGVAGPVVNERLTDLIIDAGAMLGLRGILINDPSAAFDVMNVVIRGMSGAAFFFGASGAVRMENTTVVDSDIGYNLVAKVVTLRNCVAYDCTTDFLSHNLSTGIHCTSSDATANGFAVNTNNVINALSANDLQSKNVALATFCDIVDGGGLDSTGVANTLARTRCIRNRAVPNADGLTSRGAAEVPTPEPPPPPPTPSGLPDESRIGIGVAAHGLGL